MKKMKIISITIIAAILILSIAGCSPKPFSVGEIILCKEVDSNFAPIDPAEVFPAGTTVVYLSIKVNNMTPEDKITVVWNYLEADNEINITDFSPEENGSGYIGFNIEFGQGFPSGRYNAEVYLNDEFYQTIEFSVEG
ncbi:MAG: hypothetical protein JW770_04880 [Actinobacteria bacterium]|nr:hypothetical protein [Actinomycetota bacterium]